MTRVAEVNREIKKLYGPEMKLRRGRGYYYVNGGPADDLNQQGIYVYRAEDMSLEWWLEAIKDLFDNNF